MKNTDLTSLIQLFKRHFKAFEKDFRKIDHSKALNSLDGIVCERNAGSHSYFTADETNSLLIDITKFFELMKKFDDDEELQSHHDYFQSNHY
jgi:hypothetical protein